MRCCFARNQSSDLNGFRRIFFSCLKARNLGGNLFKEWLGARNYYGSTEDTEGTDG